jgi:hypothetical protein
MVAPRYWFPAKRYGWGWQQPGYFVACAAILCSVLVGVCYVTGEPPSWRWGKK